MGALVDLYACICVSDIESAKAWYAKLLGSEPDFVASETEIVWVLAENRSIAVEQKPADAGHSLVTVFFDDFDARLDQAAARGLIPAERITYRNGVRKALFRDPDNNEIGFGGAPESP